MRIFWREWRVFWDIEAKAPVLYSMWVRCPWTTGSLRADQLPESTVDPAQLGQLHGIHALVSRPGNQKFLTKPVHNAQRVIALGAIDGSGKVVEHADGVVRVERARILALRLEVLGEPARCGHTWLVALDDERMTSNHLRVAHCPCWLSGDAGYFARYGHAPDDLSPYYRMPIVYGRFDRDELASLLLQVYEVPELPRGIGPWEQPWGGNLVTEGGLVG